MQTTNLLAAMFNIDECKKAIENCPKDEVIILLGHYSINKPKYNGTTKIKQTNKTKRPHRGTY